MNKLRSPIQQFAADRHQGRHDRHSQFPRYIHALKGCRQRGLFLLSVSLLIAISLFLHPIQASYSEIPPEAPAIVHYKAKLDAAAATRPNLLLYLMHQPMSTEASYSWIMLAVITFSGCILHLKFFRTEIYKRLLKLMLRPNKFRSTFVDIRSFST
ncbi:hypothetical protein [Paenibacillus pinihumi]|uniref:hypothetical protein n=1 Tax=Paenibacillus pinihumi TaxID=669462 RepID=UPI000425272B|nr:hypothetical protein [Paenibacillus pinihumi]